MHPRSRRRFAVRLVAVGAGLLAGVVFCELGLRVHHQVQGTRRAAAWRAVGATAHVDGPVKLGHIIRPHSNRKIIYELIPGADHEFKGARVMTNAAGFRGPGYPREAAHDVLRIVGLGDSVLFGWGVEYEDSYLPVLEALLEEGHPDVAVEVVNTAVPGYNTVIEVETLRVKGLAYHPDLVVIDHVSNDLAPPNFVPSEVDCWTLSRSFLVDALRAVLTGESVASVGRFSVPPDVTDRKFWETLEADRERVPAELRDLVGLSSYRRAMGELAELAREHGFLVLVATHQEAPAYLREVCGELGFPLVETYPRLERYMEGHGITTHLGSTLTVSETDTHPSPLAHRMQAEELYRFLIDEGLWQELLARRPRE